ncbi:hypothetical protein GCG54_00015315 [Colletotrichum gloeosporioides]|uniref:Uncharacterized protein n=1 Tax=Colletotrichum gloeosporioides TaxID=474922 RepID=A0A8H4C8I8_COLGL|nr:uncharacterized protein GCG54_00015315 [Colletotrichum gloeosporioides]KAF3799133.1 hypothetical protein GCG54_00015315 [Colletotrichum gloeosporioides]
MLLPETVYAWQSQVRAVGIANAKLGDIKADGHFSGSTIPYKAFLQLRAVWLPLKEGAAAPADLETAGFFNRTDRDLATSCLDANHSRLENFFATVEASNHDRRPQDPFPVTPSLGKARLGPLSQADDLGMFVPAFTSWQRLKPIGKTQGPPEGMPNFTPKVTIRSNSTLQENLLLQPVSRLDLTGAKSQLPPRSADELIADMCANISLSDTSVDIDTPSKPARGGRPGATGQREQPVPAPPAMEGGDPAEPLSERVDAVPAPEHADSDAPAPLVRPGRTEYEVQTSHFFVTYADTLLAHALSVSISNHLSIVPEERPYGFGKAAIPPVPEGEAAAPSSSGASRSRRQRPHLFVACPDGAAYVNLGDRLRKAFLHFELKPFRRDGSAKALDICREETAEIAAILYQEYCSDGKADKP